MTQPVEPIWLGTEHWLFEPTASGLLRQRQVTKHRAEDRAAPITVDKIQQRITNERMIDQFDQETKKLIDRATRRQIEQMIGPIRTEQQ